MHDSPKFRRPRLMVSAALLLGAGLALTGCTAGGPAPTSSDASTPTSGGTIIAALTGDPQTLDQMATTSLLTTLVSQNVFEQLFAIDDQFKPQPMLVDSYTVSDDLLTYTFTLRSGITFQDGTTMDSADVVASLNRWMTLSSVGKSVATQLGSLQATDPQTVTMTLTSPRYSLVGDLAYSASAAVIIPSEIAQAAGQTPLTPDQTIGTGPYAVSSYTAGQDVKLARYDGFVSRTEPSSGYAGAKHAYADELDFKFVADATQRLNGLRTGQWNWVQSIGADDIATAMSDPSLTTEAAPSGNVNLFMMNNNPDSVFSDVRVREALNDLVDPNVFATATYGPQDLWSPLSPAFASSSNVPMYSEAGASVFNAYDPDAAKKLFAEAGADASTPIKIMTTQTYPQMYQWAVILQGELEKIGMTVDLAVYDYPTLIDLQTSDPSSWDVTSTFYAGSIVSPTQLLWLSPTYRIGYKSDTMAALFTQYQASKSAEEAKATIDEIQSQVYTDLPVILMGDVDDLGVYATKVHFPSNWSQVLSNAWIDPS